MSRPFIPAPRTVSVEMIYQAYSQFMENVFHVQLLAPATLSDLQTLRTTFNNWDSVTHSGHRSSGVTLQRIRTKALDSQEAPLEDYALPTPRAGGVGTNPMPLNVTFCIKLSTGNAGRSARGRVYICGMPTSVVTGNQCGTVHANNLVADINTLITDRKSVV